jgi:signal transduction histidine kinase
LIRNRLALVFALLAVLTLAQAAFVWWATTSAAHHAERSVIATRMLAEYLEISGNKQRLKVWFAERMLTGDADPAVRDRLEAAMWASVSDLRMLAARRDAKVDAGEAADVETVAQNIDALQRALREAETGGDPADPADTWREVLRAFDELAGRDMRELLREAVARQEAASLREAEQLAVVLDRERGANIVLAALVVAACLLAVLHFVRRLDRPFAELSRLTESLGRGEYAVRSALVGDDEFARIGRLLDSMAASLADARTRSAALEAQLDELVAGRTRAALQAYEALIGIESDRRRFLAELSHELRTPVTVIRGEAELALRGTTDATDLRAALRRIVDAASEVGSRVQDLLDAARNGSIGYAFHFRRLPLVEVARGTVAQMQAVAAVRGVALEFVAEAADGCAEVDADSERLQQALAIVLDNAVRYSPRGGRVRVELARDGEALVVHVDDEGPGMSDAEIERAFEPHFRGAAGRALDDRGLGIGLGIAQRIVAAHRGSLDLARRAGGGLRVSLALPVAADAMADTEENA